MLPAILIALIAALPLRAAAGPADLTPLAPIAGVPVSVSVLAADGPGTAAKGIDSPVSTRALGGAALAQAPLPGGPVTVSNGGAAAALAPALAPAAPAPALAPALAPARRPMPRPAAPAADRRDGA
jgi:hypothetical protein